MRKYEHGGDIYRNDQVSLDFSVNTNALGMPHSARDALVRRVDEFSRYPDPHCQSLREKIATHENIEPEHIICGNGAADLIYRLVYTLKPKRALLPAPTFSEYERALSSVHCAIEYHLTRRVDNFQLTKAILDQIHPDLDLLFLCQPNNPTGQLIGHETLRKILEKAHALNTYVVVDECFLDFTDGKSVKDYLPEMPHLIVLKAFTKIYALAGLRLGYMLSTNPTLMDRVKNSGQCWSVSVPAQIAGEAALAAKRWLETTRDHVKKERDFLTRALVDLGLHVYPSDANFLLFESEVPLYDALLDAGILIRRCVNFVGLDKRFYRIAVKKREENERLIRALAAQLAHV